MSQAKVTLGRRLFFETRLSVTARYACASCHRPSLAFTDGRAHAQGATGELLHRSAMTLANVAYSPSLTWGDPRVRSLEAQMRQPLFNTHPVEMGLTGEGRGAVSRLSADPSYVRQFAEAFPDESPALSMDHIIKAIATFERTLISGRSPFDRYVFDDDRNAMAAPAVRGMALFYSPRIGCAQCHSGLNFSGPISYRGHLEKRSLFANNGLYDIDIDGFTEVIRPWTKACSRISGRPEDMGRFKVPTLRNIGVTAPYMHDGSMATLDAVLDHYQLGGHHSMRQDVRVRSFALSQPEREELLAFLNALTDPDFLNAYADPQ